MIMSKISIRYKIVIIILIVIITTLSIGFTIIITKNIKVFREEMYKTTFLNAKLTASYCVTPLLFGQPDGAYEMIKSLETIPYIKNAYVYNENHELFTSFNKTPADSVELPDFKGNTYYSFENGFLHLVVPIVAPEKGVVGKLYLRASTETLDQKITNYIIYMAILMAGLVFVAFILANGVQKIISKPILQLASVTDNVTKNRDYSIRIKKKNDDEIGILYDAFNKMLHRIEFYVNELERNNQELSEFNYVASHDLREPLRTLTSYCELLEEDIGADLSDDAEEDIKFITKAANRMDALIQDLLQLSRAGRVEFEQEAVDLTECLDIIKTDLKFSIEKVNGTLKYKELPTVKGDKKHIIRLLQNLISNALKFHKENQPPVVEISANEKENSWEIAIADNGIGIEQQHIEQIFSPFKRLHGVGKYEGTGIGLAISKKIVERHGGTIAAESEIGKGTTFFITLPKLNNAKNRNLQHV